MNAPRVGAVGDTPASATANRRGGVLVLNRNGEAIARGSVPDAVVYAGPLFADADGDGTDEVLVVTEDGVVRALSA
ncbi:MAG: hypothetical protein A07HR67_00963 [uncultured archaeon A07HR67]|nr:MAG: hypothetical protein A07HR67_00963 [uncultured archaeon A07HR67]